MWSSYCRKTVGVAVALTTVLSAPQIAQAQLSCSGFMDPTIQTPPTSPGNTYDIGDTIRINLRFGPESINGGTEIAISSIFFCLDGGSLGACADEGAVISYDGDATTLTDCVDGSGGAITVVSNSPGGGTLPNEIEFTFEDTNGDPTTIVIPTSGECNISFDVTILNFGTDGSPFSVQERALFEGNCDNGLEGGAVGTLAIPLFHNPMINIDKESSITSICDGVETSVTYFYDVTNPGNVCLENILVTDDTCGPVNFTGGDIGSDGILCPGEIWTYTCTTSISQATTNIATATGDSVVNGQTVQDTDDAFVDSSESPSCIVTANPPVGEDCPIELCAEVTGDRPPFSYLWSTGETTQCISVSPTDPTVFSVTVTDDNGCTTDCELLVECPVDEGGEGCTPGYWKQPHHFDDWTDPYDPDDLFSEHFDDAFPGKTLLQVLSQPASSSPGPNSLNNLGRHTVAALLNAANPDVDFSLSEQDVIDMFNDVYPGSTSDYQDLKNLFAAENELGCPLSNSDLNFDLAVDGEDLGILLANWGGSGIGDINLSGAVDGFDLVELLTDWTN